MIGKLRDLLGSIRLTASKILGFSFSFTKKKPVIRDFTKANAEGAELIRPLGMAENNFLEVLLTNFQISRTKKGYELDVYFNDDTPAIWTRHGKNQVRQQIENFGGRVHDWKRKLETFFDTGIPNPFTFEDSHFPFRYVSGGAVPILRFTDGEFYCLFYRDIFPVGWNIANGGSDTRNELLHPQDTIERELREELIIIDKKIPTRCVFPGDVGKPLDHPQFHVARKFWRERFPDMNLPETTQVLDMTWIDGPDRLLVTMGNEVLEKPTDNCFLNINAEDFGIEIDKVVIIEFDFPVPQPEDEDSNLLLLDGEISEGQLVNRIVGLFEVSKLDALVARGCRDFTPDIFFYDARCHKGDAFDDVLRNSFLPYAETFRTKQEVDYYGKLRKKFDLCPVTRSLLKRYNHKSRGSLPCTQ